MVTQNANKLSHEEALELLPWHANASLRQPLAKQVADHVIGCETCQQESTLLSSAILAINTEEPDYRHADDRFQNLMGRIRQHERQLDVRENPVVRHTLREWLATRLKLSPAKLQWATAFALGLIVSTGAILGSQRLLLGQQNEYQVYSEGDPMLRLLIQFGDVPSDITLATLVRESDLATRLQRLSNTEYAIEFVGDTDVQSVSEIRSRLLQDESISAVKVDGQ